MISLTVCYYIRAMKNKISKRKVEYIFGKKINTISLIINGENYELLEEVDLSKYKGRAEIVIYYEFTDGTSYTTATYNRKIFNNRSILLYKKLLRQPFLTFGIFTGLLAPFGYILNEQVYFKNPEYVLYGVVILALIPALIVFRTKETIDDYYPVFKITTKNYNICTFDDMSEEQFNMMFESRVKKLEKSN